MALGLGAILGIAGGTSLLGNIFGSVNQSNTIRAQKELAQFQFDKNVEMWNMQNEYNTPSAQMSRLQDAGLNPNLVYGSGSVVGNTTSNPPQYQAPNIKYNWVPNANAFLSVLGAYQNYQKNQAEVNLLNEQSREVASRITLNESNSFLNTIRGNLFGAQEGYYKTMANLQDYNLGRAQRFEPYDLQALQLGNAHTLADIYNKIAQEAKIRAEIENIPVYRALMESQRDYYHWSAQSHKQDSYSKYYDNYYYGQHGLIKNPTMFGAAQNAGRLGGRITAPFGSRLGQGISNAVSGFWNWTKPGGTADQWWYPNVVDPIQHTFSKLLNAFGEGIKNVPKAPVQLR